MEAALMLSAFAGLSVLFFCLFCLGVLRDLRRFGNAVWLGLALTSLAVDLMERLGEVGHRPAPLRVALACGVLLVGRRGIPRDRVEREERSRNTEQNLRFSKAIMQGRVPGYRCVVVTSNFHVFRAAITARRAGVNGQVVGSPTAAYFWPTATIREFAAVFLSHKVVNLGICLLLVLVGLTLPR